MNIVFVNVLFRYCISYFFAYLIIVYYRYNKKNERLDGELFENVLLFFTIQLLFFLILLIIYLK